MAKTAGISQSIMQARRIVFSYGASRIIDRVSFTAVKDEFISIIGPSGCGKSTLLRILAGLTKPSSGEVLFQGKHVDRPMDGISFVFQDFALLPWLTNVENIKVGLSRSRISGNEKDKKAMSLIKMFGLSGFEDSYPNVLSGGMRQRVGIARAIASNPKVLLMDEPFSSLDALTADVLRKDVVELLRDKGRPDSVIMVTHNVEEAVEVSDRVIVLSDKPSRIKKTVIVGPNERTRNSKGFIRKVDEVYSYLAR